MRYTPTVLLATAALMVVAGCGSGTTGSDAPTATSASRVEGTTVENATGQGTTGQAPAAPSFGSAVQLGGDPCALLTVPEIEAALGSGVVQGGFGDDLPGRCTYSRNGDVGSGVVQITLQDPMTCNVIMDALATGSMNGSDAVRIDVGDGGLFIPDAYAVFVTHGGCVAVGGSKHGINLGQEISVSLATAAAARLA